MVFITISHFFKTAPLKDEGCSSDSDCSLTEACRNRVCVNPCSDGNPCARTAECRAQNHRAVCVCSPGMVGDPFVNCFREPSVTTPECRSNADCTDDKACVNKKCLNPCAEGNPCGGNAECRVALHRPLCYCPADWGGDPHVQCHRPECQVNDDCPYDKACYSGKCLNPCSYGPVQCGRGAECFAQNHRANCACPPGTQGNPMVSCITGLCQYNEDCADHEACDRLNRVCRPVCEAETCAKDATCTGRNHQPVCECFPGTTGNPFVECYRPRQPVEPECRTDGDCPSKLACFEGRCENPCRKSNVCTSQDQICSVVDTLPYRTMLCKCPGDTVTNANGKCIPIKLEQPVGCTSNADCADPEICTRGTCIVACHVEQCGINAQCTSSTHRAICSCAPGYEGNPLIECSPIPKIPSRPEPAECYKNDDCPFDRKCINELCVNPCTAGDPCGRGAVCFIENREPVCKCPKGYTGDPRVSCQPPSEATVGCKSNSECALSESCINKICANPCNCGQNAECRIVDHYPICYCRPGYSGNPQSGCVKHECTSDFDCSDDKTCLTGQCVNPCIVSDPCAINAECYGHNHRAACRCNPGLEGNPFERCVRVECHSDFECPDNRACIDNHCINPCATDAHPPCAQNALCYPRNHRATCHCPEELPLGNPFSYCERKVIPPSQPECIRDTDCPSKLACIDNRCQDPCGVLKPCASSAKCSVLNSVPVRTMICECPELWVPDTNGECRQLIIQTPPGCASDSECPDNEACINRQCRNPCNCGTHATCLVQNHRAVCSCEDGYHGNPNVACRTVGCRTDSECDSGKACINQNCVSPCLVRDPCGTNAECYVYENKAQCRCLSGFRGNPWERCHVVGCRSNSDCPTDKNCENAQCVNPCVYGNICSPRAECRPQNHMAVCRCPPGFLGNPYVDCRPEPVPECVVDTDCSPRLACIDHRCQDPCLILEPCHRPSICEVVPSSPVRTMICICPEGYVSSGSGTCKPTEPVLKVGGCIADSDCASDKACVNGICRNPCNCGPNAECRIKDHKPVCSCEQGYEGNPEIECIRIGCRSNDECSGQHSCVNRQCVPVCAADGRSCGERAQCYGINHRAVCECPPGYSGDPRQACLLLGCRSDLDCPFDKACINNKCQDPCEKTAVCAINEICQVYNHRPECACPPGYVSDYEKGCRIIEDICRNDGDCPTQTACIGSECINPCNATRPCGVNAECKVFDTIPVRTMVCVCLPDYQGNAAVQCDKRSLCNIEKGFVRDIDGKCVCPPGSALNIYNECMQCRPEAGYKIDETGHCVCALERGMVIDERGRCICPIEHGYRLTDRGECIRTDRPECESNDECPDHRYCNLETKTCEDPCVDKRCGINALCNATNHQAICQCIAGYTGEPEIQCNHTNFRTDFPQPEMVVSCLADGVQVKIHIAEPGFNGVLYVKGHSKDEECRRVVNLDSDSAERTELFKVHFGSCGLIHVNGIASFVLVIQKHPKLVTYKAQAYHIKCVYQTGEQNVTIGFNVSMLTTAGTIANTGPPPICSMKIVSYNGQEITSAEIGDNLMLQVDVQPASKFNFLYPLFTSYAIYYAVAKNGCK